jgi:prophage tail gpP-like protein
MPNEVKIEIDGNIYFDIKNLRVVKTMRALCSSFSATLTFDFKAKAKRSDWKFTPQKKCKIFVDSNLMLNGFIDAAVFKLEALTNEVTITGRDITCDLVDSVPVKNSDGEPLRGELKNVDVATIVRKICGPFNITVVDSAQVHEKFDTFPFYKGETCFEAIDRACKLRGVFPITLPSGALALVQSSTNVSTSKITYPSDWLISASAEYNTSERFANYLVETQSAGDGSFASFKTAIKTLAKWSDKDINRKARTMVLDADSDLKKNAALKRVVYEALARSISGQVVEVTLENWHQPVSKKLWEINTLVDTEIPPIVIDERMLIETISFEFSEAGSFAHLALVKRNAYNVTKAIESQGIKDPKSNAGKFE